jgi:hypothetical protein
MEREKCLNRAVAGVCILCYNDGTHQSDPIRREQGRFGAVDAGNS